ncbi:MAG: hypothetical protein JNM22_05535 [Saprospiraceae bacterium]|nr:hypothetical protein [Saprospiraceae bacterium]
MTLKDKATLESLVQKTWMYRGTNYTINDFTEIGEKIIFSTDVKSITIPMAEIQTFAADLLPVDSLPAKGLAIPGVETSVFAEISAGLMTSFREIQGCKDPKFLQDATRRASAKVQISKAVTDIAKTVIAGKKAMKE